MENRRRECRHRARDRRHPRREARDRARDWLKRVGLDGFADRWPHMLSGGQRKRVALAQVLIRDPDILLMDEPFGPLDAQTRLIMHDLLLRLWSEDRKAVLFVTHDLEEAIALSDRVLIMSTGPRGADHRRFPDPAATPARHRRNPALARIPAPASRHLAIAGRTGAAHLWHADPGTRRMNRLLLTGLRIAVAVIAILLWQVLTSTSLIGDPDKMRFFFSTRWMSRARSWPGSPRARSGITCGSPCPRRCWPLSSAHWRRWCWASGSRAGRWSPRSSTLCQGRERPAPGGAGADLYPVVRPGIWSKVALGVTLVFFIVFFNVYQGVREVNRTVLDNARMLGMNERQLLRHVYLPSALSWVFSSLHSSIGFAVVGAVVGEYLGSAAGLGYLIAQAEGMFDIAGVFAGMVVLSAFVLAIDALVTLVERRLLVWRPAPDQRG